MVPHIKILTEKTLIGNHLQMSHANNRTAELWKSFIIALKALEMGKTVPKYSVNIYDNTLFFKSFDSTKIFTKWATIDAEKLVFLPENMAYFTIPAGKYAVFKHKGMGTSIFEYIFSEWLPSSPYKLEEGPHFEVLGENYKQGSADSEEEIWVPIK